MDCSWGVSHALLEDQQPKQQQNLGSLLLSVQSAASLINDPGQHAAGLMPALWPLGWSGASRDVQKTQSLKDLVSLILHQLPNFNPLLLKSNLQPKPMEYIDFSDFFLANIDVSIVH